MSFVIEAFRVSRNLPPRRRRDRQKLGPAAQRREQRRVGAGEPGLAFEAGRAPRTARRAGRRRDGRRSRRAAAAAARRAMPAAARHGPAGSRSAAPSARRSRQARRRYPVCARLTSEIGAVRADRGAAGQRVAAPRGGERGGEFRLGGERRHLVEPGLDGADQARRAARKRRRRPRRRHGRAAARRRAAPRRPRRPAPPSPLRARQPAGSAAGRPKPSRNSRARSRNACS